MKEGERLVLEFAKVVDSEKYSFPTDRRAKSETFLRYRVFVYSPFSPVFVRCDGSKGSPEEEEEMGEFDFNLEGGGR